MHLRISTCIVSTLSLGFIEAGQWHPGISDPTPMGVIIFVCYFIGAAVCGVRAWRCLYSPALRQAHFRFWVFCGIALFLFGLNKQLDLHQLISQVGRDWARAEGWYENRGAFQSIFMKCLAGVGAATLLALFWAMRCMPFRFYVALLGLMALGFYVLVRTASFHQVDHFLGLGTEGFRLAWLVELGGIAITTIVALLPERATQENRNSIENGRQ